MNEIGNLPNLIGGGIESYRTSKTSEVGQGQQARMASLGTEFEGVFLSLMLKEMRNTLEGGGFFGEEKSDTYGGMFDMFVGQELAATSPLGIAEMLLENYSKHQGAADSQPQIMAPTESSIPVDPRLPSDQTQSENLPASSGISITI